ncbi:SirB1 family protein [Phormidium sp. CCY1219]|uniref:SirB1 family protein n=1 Tax=Phormidium sp. CCY1219 TaxID=2886104 RepID=UPI002D1E6219|nr:SirB1 family protein [Phormidium sp. CCY1219]MEB3831922.1 SirB1 family protein [Phormidium sp. CCY1219]
MDFPLARQYFYREIHQPEEQIDLAKAALYIAQEEYAELDPAEYLNALDTMAAEVGDRLPEERYPLRIVQAMNQYLYEDLGFTGNTSDYYNPDNSFLNRVIDRRTGIPITLSLVYLEIARRLEFPMVGIGMPGHFLMRPDVEEIGIFVDAFNGGEVMFPQDCEQRLSQIYGQSVTLQPEFLKPIAPKGFLVRMLTNLKIIYLQGSDAKRCLAAIERILLIFPDSAVNLRDRGLLYYQSRRWTQARQDLESYLEIAPDAADVSVIREILQRMG